MREFGRQPDTERMSGTEAAKSMSATVSDDDAPDRFIEVDAARLLLILCTFARQPTDLPPNLAPTPTPFVGHFTPEYRLQKLDFLLRYPRYLACELLELHRRGAEQVADRDALIGVIDRVLSNEEPELHTLAYRRFWHGAHERLDLVESWWTSRRLVYVRFQRRGGAPPQKHYFITSQANLVAQELTATVPHAAWYGERIQLLHRYFEGLRPLELGQLQYQHPQYRDAEIGTAIPDLTDLEVQTFCEQVLGLDWRNKREQARP